MKILLKPVIRLVTFTLFLSLSPHLPGAIIYVDGDVASSGDGESWKSPYKTLREALDSASNGDEIWITAGIYRPDEGPVALVTPDDETESFTVNRIQLTIRGGFENGQADEGERDLESSVTVLSGDIDENDNDTNGDGIPNPNAIAGTNALTIMTLIGGTVELDGLVFAAGTGFETDGGAIHSTGTKLTIEDCKFFYNSATRTTVGGFGGAIYASGGSLVLEDCNFNNSEASRGGAVYADGLSKLDLQDVRFQQSRAVNQGGALYALDCPLEMANSEVFNSEITGGTGLGAGFYLENSSTENVELSNCEFANNTSKGNGGAFYLDGGNLSVINCEFTGNDAGALGMAYGGAMYLTDSSAEFINSLFSGNRAVTGGAVALFSSVTATFLNCTIAANDANSFAAVLNVATFRNCIIWHNNPGTIQPEVNPNSSFDHCLVEGLNPSGTGNLDGTDPGNNPRFDTVDLGIPTNGGNYQLTSESPAIEVGDNAAYTAASGPGLDLDLNDRTFDADEDSTATIDLGAFEFQFSLLLDSDLDGLPDSYERDHTAGNSPTALDPDVDYDNDGLETLLEFGMGPRFDPNQYDEISVLTFSINAQDKVVLNFNRGVYATNFVVLSIESSMDLGVTDPWGPADMTIGYTPPSFGSQIGVATANSMIGDKNYFRLVATKIEP